MIYTVTLNPSIDLIIQMDHFKPQQLNRYQSEQKFPGGKGINVSRILHRIGAETTALGYIGGFTGHFIEETLANEGVRTDFIRVDEDTRINIKLKSDGGETEINGLGPSISSHHLQALTKRLDRMKKGDMLVLSGSIPPSLPSSLYEDWLVTYSQRGIDVTIDAAGDALLKAIPHRPFLIKPNHHELGELFGVSITSPEETIPYGQKLLQMGARHVIVSMAEQGALLFTREGVYRSHAPQGRVINSVGAGDSLVAGFVGTYAKTGDVLEALRVGMAAGSATAFSSDLATHKAIMEIYPQITIAPLRGVESET